MRSRALLAIGILIALGLCIYKFWPSSAPHVFQSAKSSDSKAPARPADEKSKLRFLRIMEKTPSGALAGRFIVYDLKSSELDEFSSALASAGLSSDRPLEELGAILVYATGQSGMEKLAALIPSGASLEFDYIEQGADDDPADFSHGLEPFGFSPGEILGCPDDVNWGKGVDVALLDTMLLPHPALASASVVQFPGRTEGAAGTPWHATAMASLICGDSEEIKGVAPSARIMSYPVLDSSGVGDSYGVATAMVDAANAGVQIICIQAASTLDSKLLRHALDYVMAKNAIVIAPCGYSGAKSYPSALEDVFCVGAIDLNASKIGRSATPVDIFCPGYGIPAAVPGKDMEQISGSGSSAAIIAGILAGILYENPGLNPYKAAEMLANYSDRTGFESTTSCSGIVNVERVRQRAIQGLRDIAVTGVVAQNSSDGSHVVKVAVQNKGTATTAFSLDITVGSSVYTYTNPGLQANKFEIYSVNVPDAEYGSISASASTQGQDINPDNNSW